MKLTRTPQGLVRPPTAGKRVEGPALESSVTAPGAGHEQRPDLPAAPKAARPFRPTSPPTDARALDAALRSLGVSQSQARAHIASALAHGPVLETFPALEDSCARAAAALKAGSPLEPKTLVAAAQSAGGLAGVTALLPALRAHLNAAGVDVVASLSACEAVRAEAIGAVVATAPASTPEIVGRAALLGELASRGAWMGNSYSANFMFSNERGLPETAEELTLRGGAAVGVSGGLLDLACATRADAVVLVDVDPGVVGFVIGLNALLLALDDARPPLSGADRAQMLSTILRKDADPLPLLAQAGVPLPRLAGAMSALEHPTPPPSTSWLGKDGASNIEHLTKLARAGRLLAVEADWADPALGPRVASILAGLETPVGVVNFSNMLDYTKDDPAVHANLRQLPARDDSALVMNSFYRDHPGTGPFPKIGNFDKPVASSLAGWTTGTGFDELARYRRTSEFRGTTPLTTDEERAAYRAEGEKKHLEFASSPQAVFQALRSMAARLGLEGRWQSAGTPPEHIEQLLREAVGRVTSPADVKDAVLSVDARFWNPEKVGRYFTSRAGEVARWVLFRGVPWSKEWQAELPARQQASIAEIKAELGAAVAQARRPEEIDVLLGLWEQRALASGAGA